MREEEDGPSIKGKITNKQAGRSRGAAVSVRPAVTDTIPRVIIVPLTSTWWGSASAARAIASAPASVSRHCCRIPLYELRRETLGVPNGISSNAQNPNPNREEAIARVFRTNLEGERTSKHLTKRLLFLC